MDNPAFSGGNFSLTTCSLDIHEYHEVNCALKSYFIKEGFIEVPTQARVSILAACEDPSTMATYHFMGQKWPLPQTGQMWLEFELMGKRDLKSAKGLFCSTTSYRDEPNPIKGRHMTLFPLFEFEQYGGVNDLIHREKDLLFSLGYQNSIKAPVLEYEDLAQKYRVKLIESEEEKKLYEDYGSVIFLTGFPKRSSPFWNMKKRPVSDCFEKVDVILHGQETFGSAARSSNISEMEEGFRTVSDGLYAKKLYDAFGRSRVLDELRQYLQLDFIERCGGGIGVSRLMRSLTLLQEDKKQY